ncbi:MAG: MazG nucleotide pyrophosphohydrolase domain-containing protein [Anaerolineales bacterium]
MLPQEELIEKVRALCREDSRCRAALMYGSFVFGEGDRYSDVEFVLFFEEGTLEELDLRAWLEGIAPVLLYTVNDFGTPNAIFENLVRGEFHFHELQEMEGLIQSWQGAVHFPSVAAPLLHDETGKLAPLLETLVGEAPRRDRAEALQPIVDNAVNWLLFGINVLERGEEARALELLSSVQRHLLLMVRVVEGRTARWHIPSRALEEELSPEAYRRFIRCTAPLEAQALRSAYESSWRWILDLQEVLHERYGVVLSQSLVEGIDRRFEERGEGELAPYQRSVAAFVAAHALEVPVSARLLDLVSEVGELAKEALKGSEYGCGPFTGTEGWAAELGDALFSLACVANSTDVNLNAALEAMLAKYEIRLATRGDAGNGEG